MPKGEALEKAKRQKKKKKKKQQQTNKKQKSKKTPQTKIHLALFQPWDWGHLFSGATQHPSFVFQIYFSFPCRLQSRTAYRTYDQVQILLLIIYLNHYVGVVLHGYYTSCCLYCQVCHADPRRYWQQGSLTWGSTHENDTLYLFNSFHALVKLV